MTLMNKYDLGQAQPITAALWPKLITFFKPKETKPIIQSVLVFSTFSLGTV